MGIDVDKKRPGSGMKPANAVGATGELVANHSPISI